MKHIARFIYNNALWAEIQSITKHAKNIRAAFAYFGTNGSEILKLKKGDSLVVDMSPEVIKQGATNPHEIKKLKDKGVQVFTRRSLHAKFIIANRTLIAGSANVSKNSCNSLDEAGIITADPFAVRNAEDFYDSLCTEPVNDIYLKECIKLYKPPIIVSNIEKTTGKSKRIVRAKLWFIGGLRLINPNPEDEGAIDNLFTEARKHKSPTKGTSEDWINYPNKLNYLDDLQIGDWAIKCIYDKGDRYVEPPAQVIGVKDFQSHTGKRRFLVMLETPNNGEELSLKRFRRLVKNYEPLLNTESPRTRPITNDANADAILRFWTIDGRIRTKS